MNGFASVCITLHTQCESGYMLCAYEEMVHPRLINFIESKNVATASNHSAMVTLLAAVQIDVGVYSQSTALPTVS